MEDSSEEEYEEGKTLDLDEMEKMLQSSSDLPDSHMIDGPRTITSIGLPIKTAKYPDILDEDLYDELETPFGDNPRKRRGKSDVSSVFGPGVGSLWQSKRRKRPKKPKKRILDVLPPEHEHKLFEANNLYIQGELSESLKLLLEVIQINPRLAAVYESIGVIYDNLGNDILALKYFSLAATYRPKKDSVSMSSDLWTQVAKRCIELGLFEHAIIAADKVIPCRDIDSYKMVYCYKAIAQTALENTDTGKYTIKLCLRKYPTFVECLVEFGMKCEEFGRLDLAMYAYLRYAIYFMGEQDIPESIRKYAHYPSPSDLSLNTDDSSNERKPIEISDVDFSNLFFVIEQIAEICLSIGDQSVRHISVIAPNNQMIIHNNLAVVIIDSCFNFLERLRVDTYRRDDLAKLQAPMIIGFLYGIGKLRRNIDDDHTSTALKIVNPLLASLSKNRKAILSSQKSDESQGQESQDNTSDDYVENYSLIIQQVRLAEEFLKRGMITRATRLATDLFLEHKCIISRFEMQRQESPSTYWTQLFSNCISSLSRIAEVLYVAGKRIDDTNSNNESSGNSLDLFHTAFEVYKYAQVIDQENHLGLSISFGEFLWSCGNYLDTKTIDTNELIDEEENNNADYNQLILINRFENYYYKQFHELCDHDRDFNPLEEDDTIFISARSRLRRKRKSSSQDHSKKSSDPSQKSSSIENDDNQLDNSSDDEMIPENPETDGDMKGDKADAVRERRPNIFLQKLESLAAKFEITEQMVQDANEQFQRSHQKFSLKLIKNYIQGIMTWMKLICLQGSNDDMIDAFSFPIVLYWIKYNDKLFSRKYSSLRIVIESFQSLTTPSQLSTSLLDKGESSEITSRKNISDTAIEQQEDGDDVMHEDGNQADEIIHLKSGALLGSEQVDAVTKLATKISRVRLKFDDDSFYHFPRMIIYRPQDALHILLVDCMVYKIDCVKYLCDSILEGKAQKDLISLQSMMSGTLDEISMNRRAVALCYISGLISLVDLRSLFSTEVMIDFMTVYFMNLKSKNYGSLETELTKLLSTSLYTASSFAIFTDSNISKTQQSNSSVDGGGTADKGMESGGPSLSTNATSKQGKLRSKLIEASEAMRKLAKKVASSSASGDIAPNMPAEEMLDTMGSIENRDVNSHISIILQPQSNDSYRSKLRRRKKLSPSNLMSSASEILFIESAAEISQEAKDAAINFLMTPNSIQHANILSKAIATNKTTINENLSEIPKAICEEEAFKYDRVYLEQRLPLRNFETFFPDSVPSSIFAAHQLVTKKRIGDALDLYLDAFAMDTSQPLTSLIIASFLILLSFHRSINNRQETVKKGLMFLRHYRHNRMIHADKLEWYHEKANESNTSDQTTKSAIIKEDAIRQEIFYNFGKAAGDIGLMHLALNNYYEALRVQDEYSAMIYLEKNLHLFQDESVKELPKYDHDAPIHISQILPLTRQSAFNAILILRKSKSNNEAYRIMSKYLSV